MYLLKLHSELGHLAKRTRISKVSSHFLTLANELHLVCFGFGACLFYVWTTLLITVQAFALIISLHIRHSAILLHLAWLNSKKLGFTLFSPDSHKGWTAALASSLWLSQRLRSTRVDLGWVYFLVLSLLVLYFELYIGSIVSVIQQQRSS